MDQLQPNSELYTRIIARIRAEQDLQLFKKKLAWYFLGTIFSFGLLVAAFSYFFSQINSAEFTATISLISSDYSFIAAHFSEYFLFLLNSLPIISIAILSLVFLFSFINIVNVIRYGLKIRTIRTNYGK